MNSRLPMSDRRRQLVSAALTVATQEGIEAVTVRRVAQEAGVSLGVVHYCFSGKDELITEMAAAIIEETAAAGQARVTFPAAPTDAVVKPATILEALESGADAIWAVIQASPGTQLLTYEITTHALREPGLASVAKRQYAVSQQAAEDFLTAAAEATGARWKRPVAELGALVVVAIDGVSLRWLVDRDADAARDRLATLAKALYLYAEE